VTTTPSETAQGKLRCELVTQFERLEELCGDWDQLWRTDPAGEIFQTFAWARAWWRAYGDEYSLHCLAVYDGETLIGVLPLVRRQGEIQFLGVPQADYADVVCEEERALEVLTTAFSVLFESRGWKECKLQHLPSHSRIMRYWRKLPRRLSRYSTFVFGGHSPSMMARTDCPDIFRAAASKKKMRQYVNNLAKLGVVNFRLLDTKLDAREHLQMFFRQQVRRQRLIDKSSHCRLFTFRGLLNGLVEELDLKDQLRFSVLELNGVPIAYQFGFDANGKYTMYQQTFDVNSWDSSPGQALLRYMFEYASVTGKHEFDFTIGDEPYKKRYANCFKDNFTLYVEPVNIQGAVRWIWRGIQRCLYPRALAAKSLLQHYRIYDALASVLRWIVESDQEQLRKPRILVRSAFRSFFKHAFASVYQREDRIILRFDDVHAEPFSDGHDIDVIESRLSDFADLLVENPSYPGDLDTWKVRKTRGDTLIIVREGGKATLALWTTSDPTAIELPSKKHAIDFDSSWIVYEHWSSPVADTSPSYRAALAFLVREAAKQERRRLWVCCPASARAQKKNLVSQGFHVKYRLQNWRVVRWLRFQRVSPIEAGVTLTADA